MARKDWPMQSGQWAVLNHLRRGELSSYDYARVVGGQLKTLHVQIHHLKARGFQIETDRARRDGVNAQGRPAIYRLIGVPDVVEPRLADDLQYLHDVARTAVTLAPTNIGSIWERPGIWVNDEDRIATAMAGGPVAVVDVQIPTALVAFKASTLEVAASASAWETWRRLRSIT